MTDGSLPYENERLDEMQITALAVNGIKAKIPKDVDNSKDSAIVALKKIFRKCQTFTAKHRPSARAVAGYLNAVLESFPK